jgi:hypothetical protein
VGDRPLRPPTRRRLGAPLPHQLPDGPQPRLKATCAFSLRPLQTGSLRGISASFEELSRTLRPMSYVLLTRAPLCPKASFDLHVLGTPPAFILSQDQTLRKDLLTLFLLAKTEISAIKVHSGLALCLTTL